MARSEYAEKNRDWLRQKADEPGVETLDKGVLIKRLKKGSGAVSPNRNSVITVHYVGKTINGKTFDSSRGGTPPAFRLRDLVPGWIIALQKMTVGEKAEIYIPTEQGYGRFSQPGIPGGSTLIFEIELIAVN